jgi:hypothetical protein
MKNNEKYKALQIDLLNYIESKRKEIGIPINLLVNKTSISSQNYIKKLNKTDIYIDLLTIFELCEKMDLEIKIRPKVNLDLELENLIEEKKMLKKFRL